MAQQRWWWCLFVITSSIIAGVYGGEVTYDGRSLIINGERKILFSGSIHYPRSTPDMWPSIISKAKQGGLDVIQTYVFWNLHEPQPDQYDFSGRSDIVRFLKEIHSQGLFVSLRIGPFIESEWNYGGLPIWLRDVPGIVFRSNNDPFKFYMQKFTTKIVNMMKSERLFASQGGPIILSQIENEYQNIEKAFVEDGRPYVHWASQMAVSQHTGVPWMMCAQDNAPDPMINTCNGRQCGETFVGPNSPSKPAMWTENWTTRYQVFGGDIRSRVRTAEDIAYHTALFIAKKNGSFINYYMYHGGTNFGRTGSAFTPPSYYDLAPLDEYGQINQPKWGHLKELHAAVKLGSQPLLSGKQSLLKLGRKQDAYIFRRKHECIAFLVNSNRKKTMRVTFNNLPFHLPPLSISILPDCKTVAFNTATVNSQHSTRSFLPIIKLDSAKRWEQFKETIPIFDETSLRSNTLLDQLNTTKDASDYLWYTFSFEQGGSSDSRAHLSVDSLGHVVHAYVNGLLVGSAHGTKITNTILTTTISLNRGLNNISILSVMVGLPDSGPYLERRFSGLRRVRIVGKQLVQDFTNHSWGNQVGLVGEKLKVYRDEKSQGVQWNAFNSPQPLSWYKTKFDAPEGSGPVVLNLGSMGKGEAWINGQSIGRYWISFLSPFGNSTQTWYNVPRSFLKSKDNQLVLVDEESGNPLGISIDTVSITKVCGHVSDIHPPFVVSWRGQNKTISDFDKHQHGRRPKFHLRCPSKKRISQILFASYGTPKGNCKNFSIGRCHLPSSKAIVEKACIGKWKCTVPQSNKLFKPDPCSGVSKSLLVQARCD
ncbi:beta-galactosidase 16-like [Impatiens glandulifera]|uniref:beta-galactosidase 16-like n=1 Tax=Impatiens glandulifera TaxID=253017 RepID=UPI001FB0E927|nr:beta-galactosidase 16-like [Impatiens glandulifera]